LSTKMQVSCGPIALCNSAAVTDESTPPDRPQMTLALPTVWRIVAIDCSTKFPIVHEPAQRQILVKEVLEELLPRGVCVTSGWNCTP